MKSGEEGTFLTETLVILIFVYLAGVATGIIAAAYWRRLTSKKEEPEDPPPPPPAPRPIYQVERIDVVVPPESIRVGITSGCYRYHDEDNPGSRCKEMEDLVLRNDGKKMTKRFTPCLKCFPQGAYINPGPENYFTTEGLPRGARPRRVRPYRDNVPLQVAD